MLDLVHRHSQSPQPGRLHSYECDCVIDRTFTGRLQSDIVCQVSQQALVLIDLIPVFPVLQKRLNHNRPVLGHISRHRN